MAQRIQQGSILGFVLVGALLTALVIGGIFVVRNQLAKNGGTQNPGSTQVAKDQTGQDDNKSGTSSNNSNSDSLKKALEQQQAEEKKAQEQKAASEAQSNSTSSSSSAAGSTGSTSAASNLPTTGPADAMWTVLGATALAGVSIAYVRSRSLI